MKYIKTYESLNNNLQIGDYVYCEVPENEGYNPNKFIGQITTISDIRKSYPYKVKYPLINNTEDDSDRLIRPEEIIYSAKTPEELEHYITGNKYNL